MTALAQKQYEKALELISGLGFSDSPLPRLAMIGALDGLGRRDELIEILDKPRNVDEATKLISLLLENGRADEASEKLKSLSDMFDQATNIKLAETVAIKRMIL